MNIDSMESLYVFELQDMYNAENQLVKALPKIAKAASSQDLADAIQSHLEETMGQVDRLESIFRSLGKKASGQTCEAMKGLIKEGEEIIKADAEDSIRDAGIIIAAQKVEHYEIAAYGSLCAFARILGRTQDLSLLSQTLDQEKAADSKLNSLAADINSEAASSSGQPD